MATGEATPNPVNVGEVFKIEGVGFALDEAVTLDAPDSEEPVTSWARPGPEGGVVDFFIAIGEVGTHELTLDQGDESATVEVEVVSGWPTVEEAEDEGEVEVDDSEAVDYAALTKAELVQEANSRHLDFPSTASKGDLVALLTEDDGDA